jgi:hypothetical protein
MQPAVTYTHLSYFKIQNDLSVGFGHAGCERHLFFIKVKLDLQISHSPDGEKYSRQFVMFPFLHKLDESRYSPLTQGLGRHTLFDNWYPSRHFLHVLLM